jgi:hypothetical protein
MNRDYHVVFFGGGETADNKFNCFTGSFIMLLSKILEDNFSFIKGIYYSVPALNVIWGLNHGQKPVIKPENNRIIVQAMEQLIPEKIISDVQLIILSSSAGSIVAAQAACLLAKENLSKKYYLKPFHLVLGTTFISKESELWKALIYYHESGLIGTIIFDELQDQGDSINGAAGRTRTEAWSNAFGLICPWFSRKYSPPSFLKTHPVAGHIHRRRSQTIQKAIDFIEVIFIRHNLAGEHFRGKAAAVIEMAKQEKTSFR